MNKLDPNEVFPMVLHEISVRNYYCCEYSFPEDLFHRPDVGIRVIYYRSNENRINYTAWCFIKSIPLMRLVSVTSLALVDTSQGAANKLVTDYILKEDGAMLPACQRFLDWIEDVDNLELLENNPHGSEYVERFSCCEFYLPGCLYNRPDIRLQIVYRSAGEKIKYNVWCHLDHYPLLWHIGNGELQKSGDDMSQDIISHINDDEQIFQKIEMFLDLVETIQL